MPPVEGGLPVLGMLRRFFGGAETDEPAASQNSTASGAVEIEIMYEKPASEQLEVLQDGEDIGFHE